jgi:hypothetical protein
MNWQTIFGRFAVDFRMPSTMTFVTNSGCGETQQRNICRIVVKILPSGELSGTASVACEDVLQLPAHFFLGFFLAGVDPKSRYPVVPLSRKYLAQ